MKSFCIVLLIVSCAASILGDEIDATAAGSLNFKPTFISLYNDLISLIIIISGELAPSIIHGLLQSLSTSLATGDSKIVIETLQAGENGLKEILPKVNTERARTKITMFINDVSELIKNLTSGQANLDDVRAFLNNAKDKVKQRLAERFKGFTEQKSI